jgi:hypothetical protein
LKVGRKVCAALGANVFRDAMLDTPVPVEVVSVLGMIVIGLMRSSFRVGVGTTLAATTGDQCQDGERQMKRP